MFFCDLVGDFPNRCCKKESIMREGKKVKVVRSNYPRRGDKQNQMQLRIVKPRKQYGHWTGCQGKLGS